MHDRDIAPSTMNVYNTCANGYSCQVFFTIGTHDFIHHKWTRWFFFFDICLCFVYRIPGSGCWLCWYCNSSDLIKHMRICLHTSRSKYLRQLFRNLTWLLIRLQLLAHGLLASMKRGNKKYENKFSLFIFNWLLNFDLTQLRNRTFSDETPEFHFKAYCSVSNSARAINLILAFSSFCENQKLWKA